MLEETDIFCLPWSFVGQNKRLDAIYEEDLHSILAVFDICSVTCYCRHPEIALCCCSVCSEKKL